MGRPKGLDVDSQEAAVDYRDSGLDREFLSLLRRNRELYQPSKEQAEYKDINKRLASMLATVGHKTVEALGWRVTFVPGVSVTIDAKKLLELGVSAQIIKKATRRTTYETVNVTAVREEK